MSTHIAFSGSTCLASGSLLDVASCLHAQEPASDAPPPLVFELETGRQIDLDLSGTHDDIVERFSEPGVPAARSRRPAVHHRLCAHRCALFREDKLPLRTSRRFNHNVRDFRSLSVSFLAHEHELSSFKTYGSAAR